MSDKEKIKDIKEKFKITEHQIGNTEFKAIDGVSCDEIEWVINRLADELISK